MSLTEVARRAGVSLATASRVLSKSDYHVSDDLRDRVMRAAEEANYVPDAAARALSSRIGQAVGIIIGDVRDAYFSELVHGIQTVLDENGRLLYICSSHWNPEREAEYIRMLHSNRVAAIVVACSEIPDTIQSPRIRAYLKAFQKTGGIVVTLGRDLPDTRNVQPDNFGGARAMAEALIGLGHREFGIITGPKGTRSREERLSGVYAAAKAHKIPKTSIHLFSGERSWDAGARAAERLITDHPGITAIFGLNDKSALGALSHVQRMGRRVPEDVSVAGFDDIASAVQSTPPLSTVRINLAEMSRRLALAALAPKTGDSEAEDSVVPTTLVMRESTGPAPQRTADKALRKMASS